MPETDDNRLAQSPVVANCAMNRERVFSGPNSYCKDLSVDLVAHLQTHVRPGFAWLDVCCGTGAALLQAQKLFPQVRIVGVDLVPYLHPGLADTPIEIHISPIQEFPLAERYDLMTCVHGLHYLGDKLGILAKLLSCLTEDGLFVANLNLMDITDSAGSSLGRRLSRLLREQGIDIDHRRRLIRCTGPCQLDLPATYLGSDDQAGPNYTGQPVVRSIYAWT